MRIRKVAEPFKQLSGQAAKCLTLAEALADLQTPCDVVCLDKRRKQKALEMSKIAAVSGGQ